MSMFTTTHTLHTSLSISGRALRPVVSRGPARYASHTSHALTSTGQEHDPLTTTSPEPIPIPIPASSSSPPSSPRHSTIPVGSPGSPGKSLSNRSPAPKQTFHKDKSAGFHYLTDTHLLQGVTGAAHFSSAKSPPTEEEIQSNVHRRMSSSAGSGHRRSNSGDLVTGIRLEGKRKQVFEDVIELFSSRPSLEIFQRGWREDAVFEDPLSRCVGYKEYAPQWFGMPKLFPVSKTLSARVISSTTNPNQIVYEQEQEYTVRGIGSKKVMKSTVVITLDEQDRVIKLDDKWNGKDHPTRWGALFFRRLNARTMPWLISVPKFDKKSE